MRRPAAIALGVSMALLGGINLLEFVLAPRLRAPAPMLAHLASGQSAAAVGAPGPAELAAQLGIITGRPLFEPSRRPPAIDAARAATPVLPRVTGIVSSPTARFVVFAPEGGGKPVVVPEGSRLDGFLIQKVADGEVTVVDQHGSHVLRPSFDPAGPAGKTGPRNAGPVAAIGPTAGGIVLGQPAAPAPGGADQGRFADIPGLHGRPLGLSTNAAAGPPAVANPPAFPSLAAPDDRTPGRRTPSLSPSGDVP